MEEQCKTKSAEEKILVTIRLRPLNEREINNNDHCAWKCVDDKTIAHAAYCSAAERSCFPQFYVYDQVFGLDASTIEVYEKGAKDVAISALTGKNATIFAYGQTSSGKTYTMRGIMENAADDIFRYIKKHIDRAFIVKFSALEIYNEVVNDLLNPDSGQLRLLDDPEKGTVVEGLTEKVVQDKDHLHGLLAVCETQRQVGETALNDISSRSHQIIRLTIQSSPQVMMDEWPAKSLVAVLNFIDLAGSERASLSQSDGTRLKEGCYINRSLLTLSTVIRKLSESNKTRGGHVPYRDSKLTRILQNSLGGNARTAIICTISPSNRHVEQTRNTLFFASCAKEVTNRAQVNTVISDKYLIKQLKKEIALLEAKLQLSNYPTPSFSEELIIEKDMLIQKMQDEMLKVMQQRDLVQAQLNNVLKQMEGMEQERQLDSSKVDSVNTSFSSRSEDGYFHTYSNDEPFQQDVSHSQKFDYMIDLNEECMRKSVDATLSQLSDKQGVSTSDILLQEIYKLENLHTELAQDASQALEAVEKEVECLCISQLNMNQEAAENIALLQQEIHGICESRMTGSIFRDLCFTRIESNANDISFLKENKQKEEAYNDNITSRQEISKAEGSDFRLSLEDSIQLVEASDRNGLLKDEIIIEENNKEKHEDHFEVASVSFNGKKPNLLPITGTYSVPDEATGFTSARSSVDDNHQALRVCIDENFSTDKDVPPEADDSVINVHAYVMGLRERVAELQEQKELLTSRVSELEKSAIDVTDSFDKKVALSPQIPNSEFRIKQKQIFELWDICQVPITYRSHFYLLFHGDPADAIYVEVELRRLTWLRNHNSKIGPNQGSSFSRDKYVTSPELSQQTLKRERKTLIKSLKSTLTSAERDELYRQWGIPLNTKRRKLKLVYLIWTNPHDEQHIKMSAELVARILKLWDKNGYVSKEMFLLSFPPLSENSRLSGSSIANFFNF